MTDKSCDTCANPLMRTPRNKRPLQVVCVVCGEQREAIDSSSSPLLTRNILSKDNISSSPTSDTPSVEDVSTPATDISRELPTPEFHLPLMDTEESLRRRAQSDRASTVIGQRLLQGWAMLAEECPRPTCFGIPLIRPPRSGDGSVSKSRVGILNFGFDKTIHVQ